MHNTQAKFQKKTKHKQKAFTYKFLILNITYNRLQNCISIGVSASTPTTTLFGDDHDVIIAMYIEINMKAK